MLSFAADVVILCFAATALYDMRHDVPRWISALVDRFRFRR